MLLCPIASKGSPKHALSNNSVFLVHMPFIFTFFRYQDDGIAMADRLAAIASILRLSLICYSSL